ncbi:MAG TPA: Stp1/IreP family PP2C-type Ser/Thr phosphatase [Ferruginibacter sp.]|nr:Stp1/IreP family PP2C-type Ser/Thr phosphatase [Ferruginibacter sp.]
MFNLFGKKAKQLAVEGSNGLAETGGLHVTVLSDMGNIRTNNEDTGMFYKVADENIIREKGYLMLVADGMGGHNAGEVASRMAGEIISQEYFNQKNSGTVEKNLAKVFILANKNIFEKARSAPRFSGMGTTCTALVVIGQTVYYAHVGDSRAYMQKGDTIVQITQDHTYVQELVNQGEITAEEAAVHPKRNILTNAMGTKADMRVDTGKFSLRFEDGDKLLICSDGLYDYLNNDELKEILKKEDPKNAATIMIGQAKARGGHDNITVVIAEREGVAGQAENGLKLTRDAELPKLTRDADLPTDIAE